MAAVWRAGPSGGADGAAGRLAGAGSGVCVGDVFVSEFGKRRLSRRAGDVPGGDHFQQ